MATTKTQVAVIGGGPGGYTAAFAAADLGLSVTLIEASPLLGGVCLHRGCIPSKTLLHVAEIITEARHAAEWGVQFSEPQLDIAKLRSWKDKVIQRMSGGLSVLAKQRKITVVQGRARLQDSHNLAVEQAGGGTQTIAFDYAILATGSRPLTLPNLALDSPRVLDSTGALALEEIPESLLVIGGGYIGAELATVYAALGAKVTIVEMTGGLLPGADADLVSVLQNRMKHTVQEMLFNTKVVSMTEAGGKVRVRLEGAGVSQPDREFDRVLVAIGRRPNTEGLGLENTRIELDPKGFVKVDAQMRTAEPHIFAIGDIAGQPMLAHKAAHEGRVAAEVIAGRNVVFAPHAIPAVVFTDPEIAWCGLTENQAKAEGREIKVVRFPWAASGRATTLGRNEGVTKLIVDPQSERILGVGIAGPGAGELISEGVLAVEMAALAADVQLSIHPHPTLSETLMEAAEAFYGHSTHYLGR